MYIISKRMEISSGHFLNLPYESKCQNYHGHNWIVIVEMEAEKLTNGMVFDFTHIKIQIHDQLDHKNLNDIIRQPTAENMAKWICDRLEKIIFEVTKGPVSSDTLPIKVTKVSVQESEGNVACYIP